MERTLRPRHVEARVVRAVLVWLGAVALLVAAVRSSPTMVFLDALTIGAVTTDEGSRTWQGGAAPSADKAEAAAPRAFGEARVAKRVHDRTPAAAMRLARVTLPTSAARDLLRPLRVLPSAATRARALSMVLLN